MKPMSQELQLMQQPPIQWQPTTAQQQEHQLEVDPEDEEIEKVEVEEGPVQCWKRKVLDIMKPFPSDMKVFNSMRKEELFEVYKDLKEDLKNSKCCPGCLEPVSNRYNLYKHVFGLRCKFRKVEEWRKNLDGAAPSQHQEAGDSAGKRVAKLSGSAPSDTATQSKMSSRGDCVAEGVTEVFSSAPAMMDLQDEGEGVDEGVAEIPGPVSRRGFLFSDTLHQRSGGSHF